MKESQMHHIEAMFLILLSAIMYYNGGETYAYVILGLSFVFEIISVIRKKLEEWTNK